MSSSSSLGISWVLSTISGYGIYGLQIALQFLRRGGTQLILTHAPSVTELPPLCAAKLAPAFELARKLNAFTHQNPGEFLSFKHAMLHGCSSDFSGFAGQDLVWGKPNVACCAIEHLVMTDHGRKIAKNYDMFIAISRWNADYLQSLGLHGPTYLCYQGIDPTLFHPGPRSNLYPNRFVVFSGGKFEYRKGQDIALAAFKRFRQRHPEALLVCCWQNLSLPQAEAFSLTGLCDNIPEAAPNYGLQLTPWLLKQGLPQDSFIDLPFVHNLMMPWILRECDVAIFPNRCEGGTNLVAMEAMACGVPTIVAYNTGQMDLADLMGAETLRTQNPVKATPDMNSVADWGETDVDELVEAMERIYTNRAEALKKAASIAESMKAWDWASLNDKLLQIVCDSTAEAA